MKRSVILAGLCAAMVSLLATAQQQQAQQQTQQEAQAQEKQRKDSFNRAFSACLEGSGYTVK